MAFLNSPAGRSDDAIIQEALRDSGALPPQQSPQEQPQRASQGQPMDETSGIKLIGKIATQILGMAKTDEEADKLYQQALPRLESAVPGMKLPATMDRISLSIIAARADDHLGGATQAADKDSKIKGLQTKLQTLLDAGVTDPEKIAPLRQELASLGVSDIRDIEKPEAPIAAPDNPIGDAAASNIDAFVADEAADKEKELTASSFQNEADVLARFLDPNEPDADSIKRLGELAREHKKLTGEDLKINLKELAADSPKKLTKEQRQLEVFKSKEQFKQDQKTMEKVTTESEEASANLKAIEDFRKNLNIVATGRLTSFAEGSDITNASIGGVNVGALAVPITSLIRKLSLTDEQATALENINAIGNGLALAKKKLLGGGILSDSDILLLKSTAPGKSLSPKANLELLKVMEKGAKRLKKKEQFFREFKRKHGSLDTGKIDAETEFRKIMDKELAEEERQKKKDIVIKQKLSEQTKEANRADKIRSGMLPIMPEGKSILKGLLKR